MENEKSGTFEGFFHSTEWFRVGFFEGEHIYVLVDVEAHADVRTPEVFYWCRGRLHMSDDIYQNRQLRCKILKSSIAENIDRQGLEYYFFSRVDGDWHLVKEYNY